MHVWRAVRAAATKKCANNTLVLAIVVRGYMKNIFNLPKSVDFVIYTCTPRRCECWTLFFRVQFSMSINVFGTQSECLCVWNPAKKIKIKLVMPLCNVEINALKKKYYYVVRFSINTDVYAIKGNKNAPKIVSFLGGAARLDCNRDMRNWKFINFWLLLCASQSRSVGIITLFFNVLMVDVGENGGEKSGWNSSLDFFSLNQELALFEWN